MPRLPQNFVDEVLAAADIAEVISQYIRLQPKGQRLWGLCPFHGEKTPSFSVNTQEQFFYCFGCHKGGDAVTFVREMEKCDYPDAVLRLAERFNIPVPELQGNDSHSISRERREAAYAACKAAARWFHNQLFTPAGETALAYLRRRGVTDRFIKRFGLGYAPDRWQGLEEALQPEGITRQALLDTALLLQRENRIYDAFRGRLMFPILDVRGRVVAFGGRVLDGGEPKYLNSPDTIIYNKRRMLYGAHLLAKAPGIPYVILTEGYMDTLSLHQAGMQTAVASCGTALTPEQAQLIGRFSKEVYLAYDGDSAGIKANIRGLDILEEKDLHVKVMQFPDGMDPDDMARTYGLEGLEDSRSKAMDSISYRLDRLADGVDMEDELSRSRYVQTCCQQVLSRIASPVERGRAVRLLHISTGIPEVDIQAESQRWAGTGGNTASQTLRRVPNPQPKEEVPRYDDSRSVTVRRFLGGMLALGQSTADCWSLLQPEDTEGCGCDGLPEVLRGKTREDARTLLLTLEPEAQAMLTRILEETADIRWTPDLLAGYLRKLVSDRYRRRLDSITKALQTGTSTEKTALKTELIKVSGILRDLNRDWDFAGFLQYLTHCHPQKEAEQLEHD